LKTASRVNAAIGDVNEELQVRYEHIQRALFQAVGSVHVEWERVAGRTLRRIRRELRRYDYVYSTNYDLLVYWAVMHEAAGAGFKDYFWGGSDFHSFDPASTEIWDDATLVYYLHGGVHLRALMDGGTRKSVVGNENLLAGFETAFESDEVPLLVSEGRSRDKSNAIARSAYLSFAYREFAAHRGGLVVFGHGLGRSDEHLVRAINSWEPPQRQPVVALSLRQGDAGEVRQEKLRLARRLRYADLVFYDAATHPLGQPRVRVQ